MTEVHNSVKCAKYYVFVDSGINFLRVTQIEQICNIHGHKEQMRSPQVNAIKFHRSMVPKNTKCCLIKRTYSVHCFYIQEYRPTAY